MDFRGMLKMNSWVTTASPSEVVDCETVNHTMLVQDDGCLRKVCPAFV